MSGIRDKKSSSRVIPISRSQMKEAAVCRKTSQEILKDHGFEIGEVLGEGSYSKVKAATYKDNNIAVKIIDRAKVSRDFNKKFLPREIETLSFTKHENIIQVIKIFDFPKKVYFFMERIERGDLLTLVRDHGALTEDVTYAYLQQMVNGLRYLHKLNIAHRDVKCENIMITDNNKIKLIDFGFCRSVMNEMNKRVLSKTFCGSTAYAPPEVLQGIPYNPMMYDVWSLGCVFFIMLTATMPFDDSNVTRMVHNQITKRIKYPSRICPSSSVKDLVGRMLEPDVTRRANLEQVDKHEWMHQNVTKQIVIKEYASDISQKNSRDSVKNRWF